ncbi:MAG: hypothetical protein O2979_01710 [Proteobacteria bacterium]|nr:hypothetical protein [Pseudomonadota bacterium]
MRCANCRRGGRALIASRGDPPASLARLRANRQLAHLGWEELRLTRGETESMVAQRHAGLGPEALDALYAKTQGWAAGLVLVLQQARMGSPIAEAPDLSTRQLVFDYLAGEILQKSDARTQEFLLQTAHLAQMTAALAQDLSGDAQAGETLARLYRDNYFVTRREAGPEPVYQYHPMFREFLLARAQDTYAKERRRQLQKSAAALMENAGQVEEAVALYRDSHDWEAMAGLIERHAPALLGQGRGETLGHWVEELPPDVQQQHPWTAYWAAASQVQQAPREGRLGFERAYELFRVHATPDAAGMVLACSGAMDAILYELDDFSLLDRWIAVLDEMARAGARLPSPEAEARVACSMFISLTLRQPQRRDIEQWIERAIANSLQVPDPNLKMFVGLLAEIDASVKGGGAALAPEQAERLAARLLELYRGAFLANEAQQPWCLRPRERLRSRFSRALGQLARHWDDLGQPERARDLRERSAELEAGAPAAGLSDR